MSSLPHVPTTVAPASAASWTAYWPVPPAAAVTSTVSPAATSPSRSSAIDAVMPLTKIESTSGLASGTGTARVAATVWTSR